MPTAGRSQRAATSEDTHRAAGDVKVETQPHRRGRAATDLTSLLKANRSLASATRRSSTGTASSRRRSASLGSSQAWAAGSPYLRHPRLLENGPSRWSRVRLDFARRWFDEPPDIHLRDGQLRAVPLALGPAVRAHRRRPRDRPPVRVGAHRRDGPADSFRLRGSLVRALAPAGRRGRRNARQGRPDRKSVV